MLSLQRLSRAVSVRGNVPLLYIAVAGCATGEPGTRKTIVMPIFRSKLPMMETKEYNEALQRARAKLENDAKFFKKLSPSKVTFEVPEEKGQPPRVLFDGKPSSVTHITPVASVCFALAGPHGDFGKKENAQFSKGDDMAKVEKWEVSRRVIKLDSTPLTLSEQDNPQMAAYISFLEEIETTYFEHLLQNISHYPNVEEILREAKKENPEASDLQLLLDHPKIAPVRYPRDDSRLNRIEGHSELWFRINSKRSPNLRFDAPALRKPIVKPDEETKKSWTEKDIKVWEDHDVVRTDFAVYNGDGAQINISKKYTESVIASEDLVSIETQIEPYFDRPGREPKIGLWLKLVAATRWVRHMQRPKTLKNLEEFE
eukprot:comp12542_c0_seq1/m.7531 comp12542_c0_seq1/g.7531  ORF comp12542_c0_seq1/g.7531 comp12542_c0_seq1/m.7531 type:complete len:371 (-) comp12542_c0_seq1:955-2067(-)